MALLVCLSVSFCHFFNIVGESLFVTCTMYYVLCCILEIGNWKLDDLKHHNVPAYFSIITYLLACLSVCLLI